MTNQPLRRIAPAALILPLLAALPASGQTLNEDDKLTASDAAVGDSFGTSVAISGTTAIVGAWGNDDAGADSGSAYLFDFSDRNNIIETKLNASDGAAGDNFGWSVAISGNTASVGARWDDDSGSVYVFDTTTGQQMAKLTASDAAADDRFGGSTAISGTTAIVGANGNDDAGTDSNSGSAYLFKGGVEIVQQPEGDFVRVGDSVSFEVVLSNPSDGTYQWRRNGTDLTDGGNISGATTSTLSIVAAEQDVAYYDCVVDGISGLPLVTNRAVLAILPDPNACYPDANGDGVLDFFDISQFIIEFGRGCP
jgi:hypothetical protein